MSGTHNINIHRNEETSAETAKDRRLGDDAEWKVIQKNTFTRWINERLKLVNKHIENLETDLSDGLMLIALLEVLSGKKFQKYTKKPLVKTQMLENVTMALRFLQVSEKVKIVNIDSSDIVDHNGKLILGLIWKLILHYAISAPNWDEYSSDDRETVTPTQKDDLTPKQRLLLWIRNKIEDLPINNFTSDWNDGRAIGALVDGIAPGLCPDWEDWKVSDGIRNAKEAMLLAEEWLDVPQLIKPEEMCNLKVDELSVMTYLSQFPNAKLKLGAPLRPRANRSRVRAVGPGLSSTGLKVGDIARFTVETFKAGEGDLDVKLIDPDGNENTIETVFNNDTYLTYACSFTPWTRGRHEIVICYAGREIPKSPYVVDVKEEVVEKESKTVDVSKVSLNGPGLEKFGNLSKNETLFNVYTKDAGTGNIDGYIVDPSGSTTSVRPKIVKVSEEQWQVSYIPFEQGLHAIHISFAGRPVSNSPINVNISPNIDVSKCIVSGRGIQKSGIKVGDHANFKIVTPDIIPNKDVKVEIIDSNGIKQFFTLTQQNEIEYECNYKPTKAGIYQISVTCGEKHIGKSPFAIEVKNARKCLVKAYGPGLKSGITGLPVSFCLETNGESGALAFSIEGPSKAVIDCLDNEDGSALITYYPVQSGEYAVHVLCDDEDINDSPFIVSISPSRDDHFNPSKVKVTGDVVAKRPLTSGARVKFQVDTREAGDGVLDVVLKDVKGDDVEVQLLKSHDGMYSYEFSPEQTFRHVLVISYNGVLVPQIPIKLNVSEPSDPSRVTLSGPAIEEGATTFESTYLFVDCSRAGPGDVAIMLSDGAGSDVPMETEEYGGSSFKVLFRPQRAGRIEGKVFFADQEIPLSPFYVEVRPSVDVSSVKVCGLEKAERFLESPLEFTIDAKLASGVETVTASSVSPSGKTIEVPITSNRDGTYTACLTMHEEGPHHVTVYCEGLPVTSKPFVINGLTGCNPTLLKVYGTGISSGVTHRQVTFYINTKDAGQGGLNVSIAGPCEAKMTCTDNRDGTCTVQFLPIVRGQYDVSIVYGEQHIPGSPFKVEIKDDVDSSKIKFDDFERLQAKKGQLSKFKIDTRLAGRSDMKVVISDSHGNFKQLPITTKEDSLFEASFLPSDEGLYVIDVWYGGENVRTSKVQVLPSYDASKVTLHGNGIDRKGVSATLKTMFFVDVSNAGDADLAMKIEDHLGNRVNHVQCQERASLYKIDYEPSSVGHCFIRVFYGGDEVPGSPFQVPVVPAGDASKVHILGGKFSKVAVNKDVRVSLSHVDAGPGKLTCKVEDVSNHLDQIHVQVLGDGNGMSEILYRLPKLGMYRVNINYGGREVAGGNFTQEALSSEDFEHLEKDVISSRSTSYLTNGNYNHMNGTKSDSTDGAAVFDYFVFSVPVSPVFGFLKAEITTPSGVIEVPEVKNNNDGTVTVNYLPSHIGEHLLNISYNDNLLEGYSPLRFKVGFSSSKMRVKASGPGLMAGMCNSTCCFNVNFMDSCDYAGLAISIEGPSKVSIDLEEGGEDCVNVSYKPLASGEYVISILFAHQHIKGSPFVSKILPMSKDLTLAEMHIGSHCTEPISLNIEADERDLSGMTCLVSTPSGMKHSAILKLLDGHKLGVLFDAKEPGNHVFELSKFGRPVQGSPVQKSISTNQCSDAESVKVYGSGLLSPQTGRTNEFFIDYKNAGAGGLNISIDGPSKVDLVCVEDKEGVCKVHFTPSHPGTYILTILFSLDHVLGSPFLLNVTGDACQEILANKEDGIVVQSYSAISHIGKETLLNLMIPASVKDGLRVFAIGPSGYLDSCYFVPSANSDLHYSIGFIPKETGVHLVHVADGRAPLPGSPFTFIVGPLFSQNGGQGKVKVSGIGLLGGLVGVPGMITIDSRSAGEGNLSITMEGSLKPDINFKDRHDGTCDVVYTCSKPGDYLLSIKFNSKHVKGSPFAIFIKGSEEADSETYKKNFSPNEPASFELSGSGTRGKPEAVVRTPSGAELLPIVQELSNNNYIVRFIPRERGIHMIEVTQNGSHLPKSPYRIFVGEIFPDPSRVVCTGLGLSKGRTGELSEFEVSTYGSGGGPLQVSIEGPSDVHLAPRDTNERPLHFKYKPSSPGLYKINILFAREKIPSSPFLVEVSGSGKPLPWNELSNCEVNILNEEDHHHAIKNNSSSSSFLSARTQESTSRVFCSGEGIKIARAGRLTTFYVDASATTTQQMLSVGVLGPSGPCSEVNVSNSASKKYQVTYRPQEKGAHVVAVRWGDEHVESSPFRVSVV